MADRKYYCFCDSNCKFETMSKEQILTAIAQAVKDGTVGDIDTGFITTIKTVNGTPLKFFVGQQSEYEALTDDEKRNLFAIITNDTTKEGIEEAIEALQNDFEELRDGLRDGTFVPKYASGAPNRYAENKGKAFVFPKNQGFGIDDEETVGHFKLSNDDGFGNVDNYCHLKPTTEGKQCLGDTFLRFKEVYADTFCGNATSASVSDTVTTRNSQAISIDMNMSGELNATSSVSSELVEVAVERTFENCGSFARGVYTTYPFNIVVQDSDGSMTFTVKNCTLFAAQVEQATENDFMDFATSIVIPAKFTHESITYDLNIILESVFYDSSRVSFNVTVSGTVSKKQWQKKTFTIYLEYVPIQLLTKFAE